MGIPILYTGSYHMLTVQEGVTPKINLIEVPPKIWHPKPSSRYEPVDYGNEFDGSIFIFEKHGRALTVPKVPPPIVRANFRQFNDTRDTGELWNGLKIDPNIGHELECRVLHTIREHWDCFYKDGVRRPALGFEFTIDTGASPPVCCKQPNYGPHESKVIMDHIDTLLHNG